MSNMCADGWQNTTLGEAVEIFDHKRVPLSTKQRSHRQGIYPYYGASGIIDHIDDYLFDGSYLLISEDGANLVTRNAPIAFFATGRFWVNNHAHIVRARESIADDYFLLSYIEHADISGYITGTAQPKLSQANLKSIKLRLPPIDVQKRIAEILSSYDDLIENNTRRIAILEEMAQAIYREWFVDFRFPGHEQVEMVDSELGPVPAGWDVVALAGIAVQVRQNVQPRAYPDELFAHFSIPAFDESRQPALEAGATIRSTKHLVPEGTVLLSKLSPRIPRVWLPSPPLEQRSICSTEFVVLQPNEVPRSYLYELLSSSGFLGNLAARVGGTSTSHQRVKPVDLLSMAVVRPEHHVMVDFSRVTHSIHSMIDTLRKKNGVLRRTRDLLLPRLISGEIEVGAAEDELAVVAA